MAKPAVVAIDVYQGDRFELFFRLRSQTFDPITETWVTGDYIDLTGWTPSGMVRATRASSGPPTAVFACSLSDQTLIPGGVLCILLPVESAKLSAEEYVYDIQLSLDADHVTTWLTGPCYSNREVTHA